MSGPHGGPQRSRIKAESFGQKQTALRGGFFVGARAGRSLSGLPRLQLAVVHDVDAVEVDQRFAPALVSYDRLGVDVLIELGATHLGVGTCLLDRRQPTRLAENSLLLTAVPFLFVTTCHLEYYSL